MTTFLTKEQVSGDYRQPAPAYQAPPKGGELTVLVKLRDHADGFSRHLANYAGCALEKDDVACFVGAMIACSIGVPPAHEPGRSRDAELVNNELYASVADCLLGAFELSSDEESCGGDYAEAYRAIQQTVDAELVALKDSAMSAVKEALNFDGSTEDLEKRISAVSGVENSDVLLLKVRQ
jgi:hypothetical protein